jgi:hypothetical protein
VPEEGERSTVIGGGQWVKQSAARRREREGELELPVVGAKGQAAIGGAVGPQVEEGRTERSDESER